jgi:hypothetical protein
MTTEDLANADGASSATTASTAAPETEKVETPAKEEKTEATTTTESGKQPETVTDPAKEDAAATEAAKALQKRKQTMQERLNEVTHARREAERRAERAERDLAQLRANMKAPVADEYTDPAKLNADQVNHALDQREAKRLEGEKADATKQADEARAISWHERSELFKAENPTVDLDKIAHESRFSEATSMMIADMEEGPAVLVQLHGNPAEVRRIEGLPERQRAFALGKIAAQITQPPPKRITSAPVPITAVTGKSAGGSDDPSDMSMERYVAWRSKGGGGGRR